jgi:hypothetical protein
VLVNVLTKPFTRGRNRLAGLFGRRDLLLETLETRNLPAVISSPMLVEPVAALGTNLTLDQAQGLGDLSVAGQLRIQGTIGDGTGANGQVNWYSFTLDGPALVTLSTADQGASDPLVSELSLYATDTDQTNDPYVPLGYRLIAQADGAGQGGDAAIVRSLSANTYYVAVSGSGDRYFHPSIANSGYPGATGNYDLWITGNSLALGVSHGPMVLATDLLSPIESSPAASAANVNAVISRSPQIIRVDLSGPLDPSTVQAGQTVQLLFSPDSTFASTQVRSLSGAYFDAAANELKLSPSQPLSPGYYKVTLSGNQAGGSPVLADLSGNALGQDANHPAGQDYTFTFQVDGVEGNTAGQDTGSPAGARELGDIAQSGLVQVAGAIGANPFDPVAFDPADVNLYHFRVNGPGQFAFQAEVFAGRIGSPLDPEVSLFWLNPADNQLHLVGFNDNSLNNTSTVNGHSWPLFTDSSLFAGLTQGDYYVAVTGSGYLPALPSANSVFDPTVSHPAGGLTTGDYVLNLSVQSDNVAPQVAMVQLSDGTTLTDGAVLTSPPTGLSIEFSKPVNLAQLATDALLATGKGQLDSVYITGSQGTYYPRFLSSDASGATAQFLMFDPLPSGVYELHLSGPGGLSGRAGNPLVGNDPGGDYVVHFTVQAPARGSSVNPLTWFVSGQQNIGPLFPNELVKRVMLVRGAASSSAAVDSYQIQLLQHQAYSVTLTSRTLPRGAKLKILDSAGNPVRASILRLFGGLYGRAVLDPGTYTIQVQGWSAKAGYTLAICMTTVPEPIPPLTVGPSPAIRIRHVTDTKASPTTGPVAPTNAPAPLVALTLPSGGSNSGAVNLVSFSSSLAGTGPALDIPSGVFLALSPGPIGALGTKSADDTPARNEVYDRAFLQAPSLAFSEALVRLPVLLQTSGADTPSPSPARGGFASLIRGVVSKLDLLDWSRVLDLLYRLRGNWKSQTITAPKTSAPQAVDTSDGEAAMRELDATGAETGTVSAATLEVDTVVANEDSGQTVPLGVDGLVLAAALAVLSPRLRRQTGSTNPAAPLAVRNLCESIAS